MFGMTSPIGDPVFSHDFEKYVYQQQDMPVPRKIKVPKKPFSLEKGEKGKKTDEKKER